ncbi:peroxiredoxin-like family protein [Sulfuriflexus sp.]|uniref:peroxiredoxin-like family protein n=1 Tax=Sulfuriflexus sp. TaxID=2015443 RepID=UPI0028CF6D99|nr:peroxiredoxin-like family protein [Sulfuriflexus sp.]MDT8404773.1 peroxiredoxin-like family protein [Sulfuriflexus sp.]
MKIFTQKIGSMAVGFFVLSLLTGLLQAEEPADKDQSYAAALEKMQAEQARQGGSKFTPEERAVMQRSAATLAAELPVPGLVTGERAPDFTLPNAFGKPVSLYAELKKGPVVLVFYRGAWCPFCNLHLHKLKQAQPEFARYGAQLIAITPQKPDRSAEQIKKDGYTFEVLSDLDSKVMKAYNLYFEVAPELDSVYRKHGLDIAAFNGPGRTVLPVPGSFVIDSGGIVRAVHADIDYKQRMEPAMMIKTLQALRQSKQ